MGPVVRRPSFRFGVLTLAVVAACGFAAVGLRAYLAPDARPLIPSDDAAMIARGQTLYAEQCAVCHGASGEGQRSRPPGVAASTPLAPPHDATGHTWQHPDYVLVQLTKSGVSDSTCRPIAEGAMPKFERSLGDADILAVLAYIKSIWPADIRAQQQAMNALYAAKNAAVRKLLTLRD